MRSAEADLCAADQEKQVTTDGASVSKAVYPTPNTGRTSYYDLESADQSDSSPHEYSVSLIGEIQSTAVSCCTPTTVCDPPLSA